MRLRGGRSMTIPTPDSSDWVPDEYETNALALPSHTDDDPFDLLESELMALVDTLGDVLKIPNQQPETWQLADTVPTLHGRLFKYSDFRKTIKPFDPTRLQVKIINGD